MVDKWEPWKWYSDIWPTKAKFYTWLRGSFRNAVWNQSPIKITTKNSLCSKPPAYYTGRAKSGAYCALSREWQGKSILEVDHKIGNVSLQEEEDILDFIKHLIPPPNSLQLVSKTAHKAKSYGEKQGITYEEAVIEKKVIDICKKKEDKEFLKERGITPEGNSKLRRNQIREILKGESNARI